MKKLIVVLMICFGIISCASKSSLWRELPICYLSYPARTTPGFEDSLFLKCQTFYREDLLTIRLRFHNYTSYPWFIEDIILKDSSSLMLNPLYPEEAAIVAYGKPPKPIYFDKPTRPKRYLVTGDIYTPSSGNYSYGEFKVKEESKTPGEEFADGFIDAWNIGQENKILDYEINFYTMVYNVKSGSFKTDRIPANTAIEGQLYYQCTASSYPLTLELFVNGYKYLIQLSKPMQR